MTDWKMAMMAISPLMLSHQKLRTWGAVIGSSLLASVFPLTPPAYIAIDLLCGLLVLTRPAGTAQRAIGLLFAAMLIVDVGYCISPRADGGLLYYHVLSALGWLQWGVLAMWGARDAGELCSLFLGPRGRAAAYRDGKK